MIKRQIASRVDFSFRAARRLLCEPIILLMVGAFSFQASADYLITSFDENYYPTNPENSYGAFTWDDFSYPGVVTDGATSLIIDATDRNGVNNITGGVGVGYPLHNFDSSLAEWEIRYRVLPSNAATAFRLVYLDDDGPGTAWPRRGTDYFYDFNLSGIPVNQWQTITQPFNNFTFNSVPFQNDPGGGAQNPGFSLMQLQNIYGTTGRLNLEVDYIQVKGLGEPPPPYPGAEPDAPWRAEAATRIDAVRKADLEVVVTDALRNRLPNADVGVHMQKHEFGFGSAVQGDRLASNDPVQNMYKQKIEELFNIATVENHLKWPAWEGEWGPDFSQAKAVDAVNWLNARGIDVRGHNLVWPGYDNLPMSVQNILNGGVTVAERQQLRNAIANHINDIAGDFSGDLVAWDVINEERTNHEIMDNLPEGDGAMVDWFDQARAADPQANLYINEYDILASSGDVNSANQQEYYDTIENLLDQDAPIDGIGFQGHFDEHRLTGPEQVWEILDRFGEFGLDMQVTEFDFNTADEELQAMFTRDFMTAIFAHEGMNAFLMWGFWENAIYAPQQAMFRSDWSIKPNGEEYLGLVFDEWWTDADVSADELGEALVRAFKGEHEVSASWGEFSEMVSVALSDGGLQLEIALPFVLGDYNRDGKVSAADFTVWRDSLGATVDPGIGADGTGDGIVDNEDFELWLSHYGEELPEGFGAVPAVPEPASVLLLLIGCVTSFCSRRHRWAVKQDQARFLHD